MSHSLQKIWGKRGNMAAVVAQLQRLKAHSLEDSCGVLDTLMERQKMGSTPMVDKFVGIVNKTVTDFEEREMEAKEEHDILAKVLRMAVELMDMFSGDDEEQTEVMKMMQKDMPKGNSLNVWEFFEKWIEETLGGGDKGR